MRQLKTNDVFKMTRIIKKMQLDLSDITKQVNDDENSDQSIGLFVLQRIIENAYLAQDEINDFIGDLAGMTGKEFGELPLDKSVEIIKEFKELDGISSFFKSASLLMK